MPSPTVRLRAALLAALLPALPACDGGPGNTSLSCHHPVPIVVAGQPTGVDRCEDGSRHLKLKLVCPSSLPRKLTFASGDVPGGCTTDTDCTELPNGHCESTLPTGQRSCDYGCTTDDDCPGGQVCVCGDPVGQCTLAGGCKSDLDCTGFGCVSHHHDQLFSCHTAQDSCQNNEDCPNGLSCVPTLGGPWACQPFSDIVIGRPLLVLGQNVLASLTRASDWS